MGKNWRKMGADSFQKTPPDEFDERWRDSGSEVDSDGNDSCMHHYRVFLQARYAKHLKNHPDLSDKEFTENYRGKPKEMVRGKPRYEGDTYP